MQSLMLFLQLLLKVANGEAAFRDFETEESKILAGLRRQIADVVCLCERFAARGSFSRCRWSAEVSIGIVRRAPRTLSKWSPNATRRQRVW